MAFSVIAALPFVLLLQTPAVPPKVDPPGTYQPNTPDLVDPVLKKKVDAEFPKAARQANVRAVVTVHAVIGPDGKVSQAWVTSSQVYPDPAHGGAGRLDSMSSTLGLDAAALDAAAKWLFDAAKLHGRTVPVAWSIVFEFKDGAPAVGQLSPPLVTPPSADFAKGVRDAMAPGIVAPKILERVDPRYPSLALQEKIQGEVWMRAVVLEDGTVGDVQIIKSLDREHGMDEAAVGAAKKWKFSPATENGKPIPVVVTIVIAWALAAGLQATPAQTPETTVYEPGRQGVSTPELIRKVDPEYTDEAKRAKITGEVWLDVVVNSDGTVKVLGVKKSLDKTFGLDNAATAAAKQWLFKPAQKDGKPVPTRVVLIMEFKLSGGGTLYHPGPPVKNPVLKSKVDPKYSQEAMREKIQGEVWLDAIVETDGTVSIVSVKKSLNKILGLDDAAVAAAKQWRFEPGTLDGNPVRVQITMILEFRLH